MSALIILALLGSAATPSPTPPLDLATRAVIATFHAEGAQIYECKPGTESPTWSYREPIAALFEDGKTVGRHFAGPRWELDDGSLIKAKVVQSIPGATPADVPSLKVEVIQNAGTGRLAPVTAVYRVNTHGGVLQGACTTPGALRSVAYAADYVFAR